MNEKTETQILDTEIARLLLKQRKNKGWTVAELAQLSGVSQAMISKVERGVSSPSATILSRLAGAFGITLSKLFEEVELSKKTPARIAKHSQQSYWVDGQLGISRWSISPAGANPELIKVEIPPQGQFAIPASANEHLEGQTIWLLNGRLDFQVDTEVFQLEAGDCIALTAPANCQLTNPDHKISCVYMAAFGPKKT